MLMRSACSDDAGEDHEHDDPTDQDDDDDHDEPNDKDDSAALLRQAYLHACSLMPRVGDEGNEGGE